MRRKILVPFIAFLFASCAGNKYKIQAEMDSSIKGTAYLYYEDVLGNEHMISVTDIENGKFSFIGEPGEIPVSANMIVVRKPNDTIYNGIVILESGNINFANNHGTYTSSGTFQNNLMANLQRVINETELQILELQHNGLGSTTDSVTAKIDSLINIKNNDIKNFIANNNDKSIGVALMSKYLDIMDEEEILTIITTAGPDFIKSPLYNKIKKRYQHMRKNRN